MGLLSMRDLGREDVKSLIELTRKVKEKPDKFRKSLDGKTIAMLFEKPSTRTRVSFEVGVMELGGHPVVLKSDDLQLGRGETVADTARVLGRYVDCIMARVVRHETLEELAKGSGVPVVNGLSDREHPCQILGDLFTMLEVKGRLKGLKMAYVGDGNNVCNSLLLGCSLSGVSIAVASPPGYEPDYRYVDDAVKLADSSDVAVLSKPQEAVKDADVVYTDVWVSMGDEGEAEERMLAFRGFQIDADLMSIARKDAVFMHCLPAHRGIEVSEYVIESGQSIIWRQAENRLHVQKAILLRQFGLG